MSMEIGTHRVTGVRLRGFRGMSENGRMVYWVNMEIATEGDPHKDRLTIYSYTPTITLTTLGLTLKDGVLTIGEDV